MLGQDALWQTAQRCHAILSEHELPYAVVGGMAVSLHGYRRNTIDLDLLVREADAGRVKAEFLAAGFRWSDEDRAFFDSNGIPVEFLISGEKAGSGLTIPDPADESCRTQIEGLQVVTLATLIELKLACGLSNLRRAYRDLADVVELIAANRIGRDFARFLPKHIRKEFRELVLRARGE